MAKYKHFEAEWSKDVCVVRLGDRVLFDLPTLKELESELLSLVDNERPTNLLVNFRTVASCSTSVINGLLRAQKRLSTRHGRITLSGMNPLVRETFAIPNLIGNVFDVDDPPADGAKGAEPSQGPANQ
jgi:anti-anti-sigma regulatory factor